MAKRFHFFGSTSVIQQLQTGLEAVVLFGEHLMKISINLNAESLFQDSPAI